MTRPAGFVSISRVSSLPIKIREAHGKDLPDLLRLINARENNGKILRRTRKDIRKSIREFFVAEVGGDVVGCCALDIYSEKLAEIRSLVVEEGNREKGIATALLKRCLAAAKKRKIYEVLAITDRDGIFRRQGFSEQLQSQKALFFRP